MAKPKLTKLELQIMEALWIQGQASIREIQETFPKKDRPAYTTIQTTVYRLEGKEAVRRIRKVGNFHIFEAVVSRNAAQRKLIDDLLAPSVKFLIPFSLLVGIGSYLPRLHRAEGTNPGFYVAIEEVSQPFTQPTMPMIPRGIASIGPIHLLPAVLAAVWLSGFLVVIFQWYFRWRRIAQAIRKAVPCHERLAAQALHGLQRAGGIGSATARMFS